MINYIYLVHYLIVSTYLSLLFISCCLQNPGFDFSQAQFSGNCPDPRTFMGGIKSDWQTLSFLIYMYNISRRFNLNQIRCKTQYVNDLNLVSCSWMLVPLYCVTVIWDASIDIMQFCDSFSLSMLIQTTANSYTSYVQIFGILTPSSKIFSFY